MSLTTPLRPLQLLPYFRRIEALQRALERAEHQFHHDDLTPLLNRRGLRRACDHGSAAGGKASPSCCAMLDLDDFKSINDRHGHPVGDCALLHFAATMLRHMRDSDVLARLGGDEFALILPHTSADAASGVLGHLQRVVAATPLAVDGASVRLRFSAGITQRLESEAWPDALGRADAALMRAKRAGKSQVAWQAQPASSAP